MVNDVDKSLLDRLQALRGGPASGQPWQAPQNIKVDVIERSKTPSREDALTARLRSLRQGSATPEPERQHASPKPAAATTAATTQPALATSENQPPTRQSATASRTLYQEEEDIEYVFETDDDTLQELLADVTPDEDPGGVSSGAHEPSDDQVRALLEQLADDIPKDLSDPQPPTHDHALESDDDDGSDSEAMKRQVADVMERYQDEAETEETTQSGNHQASEDEDFQDPHDEATHDTDLPSVPSDLQDHLPSKCSVARRIENSKPGLDDITARLAALRAPSHNTDGGGDDDDDDDGSGSLSLPSVPTSRPSVQPVSRLQTRTGYTDDDVDSWCTVCLEDATLRCMGCDDDVYCARCWHEMHVGPAAAFDDRSHRAVQFTRDRKKKEVPRKVALGA